VDSGGPKEQCIRWGRICPGKGQFGGGEHPQPIVRYGEYPTCDRYFQLYSVDGCSDAAFRCQYRCNLIVGNATVRVVCGAGSMHLPGVRPSVRPSVLLCVRHLSHPAAARRYCRFAAAGPAGRRYRSIAARRDVRRAAGECGQCRVVSVRSS